MENTVFERNYEIVEKDDHATAVFERAFAPGGFMEEFTKKMDATRRWLCRRIRKTTNICSTGAMTMQSGITEGFAVLWTMSTGTRISTSI